MKESRFENLFTRTTQIQPTPLILPISPESELVIICNEWENSIVLVN